MYYNSAVIFYNQRAGPIAAIGIQWRPGLNRKLDKKYPDIALRAYKKYPHSNLEPTFLGWLSIKSFYV